MMTTPLFHLDRLLQGQSNGLIGQELLQLHLDQIHIEFWSCRGQFPSLNLVRNMKCLQGQHG